MTRALAKKSLTSFWRHCQGRYVLVWIDILEKEKFVNLSKNFIFLFYFVSYLDFVYFIFFFPLFCIYFFYKVLSIMSNEEINELFYNLQQECAS